MANNPVGSRSPTVIHHCKPSQTISYNNTSSIWSYVINCNYICTVNDTIWCLKTSYNIILHHIASYYVKPSFIFWFILHFNLHTLTAFLLCFWFGFPLELSFRRMLRNSNHHVFEPDGNEIFCYQCPNLLFCRKIIGNIDRPLPVFDWQKNMLDC